MGEFLRRHQEMLVTQVVYWHGDVEREEIERVLRHLRFVSETYGLVVPAAASRRAVADLAILLTLWVSANRGVDSMYGAAGTEPIAEAKAARAVVKAPRRRALKRPVARAARVARKRRS
jgi:hypothetical protein